MEACTESECAVRLLGLGNELLADDAFGILVAREVERRLAADAPGRACPAPTAGEALPRAADVVCSSASGFHLLDEVLGVKRLVVVDTLAACASVPGTIHVFRADSQAGGAGAFACQPAAGVAPHFVGLFDVLATAAKLGLPAPQEVTIIGVEAADCFTVGGEMHPDVRAAIGKAVEIAETMLAPPSS